MPYLPGETISKRYRIHSLLGRGAHGAVYRVWDTADQREYALKEYLRDDEAIRQLWPRQFRRLAGLRHPQLPTWRDHFRVEGMGHYLVSDFVAGASLQELLDQYGPLPPERAVAWLQSAAEPLTYLHGQGVFHLNLKPANLRLSPAGELFVVDTGLPELGVPVGVEGFAPPEQRRQQEATAASDIYSLGATLYALLTNQPPSAALKRESGLATLTSARELNPDTPPYLALVANRALSLQPAARYEKVADFAHALNNPLGVAAAQTPSTPTTGRRTADSAPTSWPQPSAGKPRRTMPTRTIWGLTVVLLILVIAVVSLSLLDREELVGGSPDAATATVQSQVLAVLTGIAPTRTPIPPATVPPTPTPAPLISQTGMRMLYMPSGVFRLGNDDGDPDEKPSQLVTLDPYFIDETEVTNAQYAQCVDAGVCRLPGNLGASYHPTYYGTAEYANYPVLFVDWYGADTFCRWRDARLPSEAEWERAAGYSPTQLQRTLFPWGDAFDGTRLNFCDANCSREGGDGTVDDGHRDTAPVTSYANGRSPIGTYNMLGNVAEWVNDWYERDYYETASQSNPRGPAEGEYKVLRGGSWFSLVEELTVSQRTFFDPAVSRATIGFRCAADVQ